MNKIDSLLASLTGAIKIIVFLTMIALFVPIALTYKYLNPAKPFCIPQIFHTLVLKLLGIRVNVIGTISTASPTLFAANHVSYLDVIALGAILPASFIAKSEVANWPLFGYLAKVQNTIFIERRSSRAVDQREQLQTHFDTKQNIVFFPEGTSSIGTTALPFKSSLFSIAEKYGQPVTVQPISITCTELDRLPILMEERPQYAWYGDMTLPPHLWNVFKQGHFTIEIIFHPPIPPVAEQNRKELAVQCEQIVATGIEQSLSRHLAIR